MSDYELIEAMKAAFENVAGARNGTWDAAMRAVLAVVRAHDRGGERHELQRYGIEWTGPSTPICVKMADGYWTPWHVAQTELTALRIENDALRTALGKTNE